MDSRNAILLAVGIGASGLLVGLLLSRSDAAGAGDLALAAEPASAISSDSHEFALAPEPQEVERPSSRVTVPTESPAVPDHPPAAPTRVEPKPKGYVSSDPRELPETTLDEMKGKRARLEDTLTKKKRPILAARYQEGIFEHLSDKASWSGGETEKQRGEIYSVFLEWNGVNRVVLPRWQYPELYEYKDEIARLDKLIADGDRELALKLRRR